MRNIKNLILIYIALRSFSAVFYNVDVIAGLNVLELEGFFFPVVLLSYWATQNFKTAPNNCKGIYFLTVTWALSITLLKIVSYGFGGFQIFSNFFRVLNSFAAFIVFPLIFKDQKSINSLMNAFFIGTLFPLLQGLTQLLLGTDIGGMRTSISTADSTELMYYGFYYKYGMYAWNAICGGLIMIYKMGLTNKTNKKREYIYSLFFILYLILASMTLSRLTY